MFAFSFMCVCVWVCVYICTCVYTNTHAQSRVRECVRSCAMYADVCFTWGWGICWCFFTLLHLDALLWIYYAN